MSLRFTAVLAAAGMRAAAAAAAADTADHLLIQLANARWWKVQRLEEDCHTTEPGEQCYAAVDWAASHGIKLHPEWYPNLTKDSSFEQFQNHLLKNDLEDCPRPCNLCHTAAVGSECFKAVTWARDHGVKLHPEWYVGLEAGASFEEFQAYLHQGGLSHSGSPFGSCPMPCHLCRTVTSTYQECYTDIKWATSWGIKLHPEWYPGLTNKSSWEEFQGFLNTRGTCPPPCGLCHTAEKGERCYIGVKWAMLHGIRKHPEWYPDLSENSTFEEFQQHLHEGHYEQCPKPCM